MSKATRKTAKTRKRRKQEEALGIVIGDLWHEVQKLADKFGSTCRLSIEVAADGAVMVNARCYGTAIDGGWDRYGLVWERPKNLTATEMARTVAERAAVMFAINKRA